MNETPAGALPLCLLIATGGTIAMKVDPVLGAPVPALSGEDLLATVPGLAEVARLEVNNLSNVPSDYMGPARWVELQRAVAAGVLRDEVVGVMVSHGTDTLEETAWFLDLTVATAKPVVLIGAQRNASEFAFDGPRNLLNGTIVCVAPDTCNKGVMITMNNQINAARDAVKSNPSSLATSAFLEPSRMRGSSFRALPHEGNTSHSADRNCLASTSSRCTGAPTVRSSVPPRSRVQRES